MPHPVPIKENPPPERRQTSKALASSPSAQTPSAKTRGNRNSQSPRRESSRRHLKGQQLLDGSEEKFKVQRGMDKKNSCGQREIGRLDKLLKKLRTPAKTKKSSRGEITNYSRGKEENESRWDTRYQELKEFLSSNGHCNVPRHCEQYPSLGIWVHKQRTKFKNKTLRDDRIAKLNDLNFFAWKPSTVSKSRREKGDIQWDKRYQELKEYMSSNGHCNIPSGHKQNKALSHWVSKQRSQFKNKTLRDDRFAKLNDLDFAWK